MKPWGDAEIFEEAYRWGLGDEIVEAMETEILAFARAIEARCTVSDMTLPDLPDGWHLYHLSETDGGENHKWVCQLWHADREAAEHEQWGKTPRAAAEAAIKKITGGKDGQHA